MVYPMPSINDLLDGLDKWFLGSTYDESSTIDIGIYYPIWTWYLMPFGLKSAPQIYQRLLDNALYGFLDQDRSDRKDVFETGEPDLGRTESVLGRRSYIDDILVTGRSSDALCEKVEKLAGRLRGVESVHQRHQKLLGSAEGGLSRTSFGKSSKRFVGFQKLPFPTNPRSMQSFLGSLNYYSRFSEDFAIYASVLYERREADFYEIEGQDRLGTMKMSLQKRNKIVTAPILQHFDIDRQPVVIVYASKWAISAALIQEPDGVYKPVTFTSRMLKPNEINCGMVDKEVLALLRILNICYTQLVTRSVKVLTRHSTLVWLLHSSGLQERLGRWAAHLSRWILEIVKCTKGKDEILGVIVASITPRKEVDSIMISIAPRKQPRQVISMPPPTVESSERLLVVSFDGSARVKRSGGAYSGIVWSLPEWTVISAASKYKLDLTINKAEYHGLLLCLNLLLEGGYQGIGRTYHKIRAHFHWRGLYQNVQRYVGQCIDCETGIERPTIHGESPGNLHVTYPFQIIGVDHIPSLPRPYKGNTELLIWIDLFTGYVIAKASTSRTAQTVAENYEECVFRRFGACEAIRHDREPGFMSNFFKSFSKIVGQRQRATMAYRPQANGTTERMVGPLTRAVKMYEEDVNQRDWDEYMESLTFALNTA
ncbi:LOW QUALITY PROTEIN: reverse transcriptase [Phytophthora palmivora]|uniref:Reverse transcriptase n=1 Tax=Phytophthora palmivora TaxID=4796 RepID=A0A2P4X2V0_9STRA|nr:LOW QUALITY PROTEIN: reverse transcriptase [Phytophthora palmivora]